MFRRILRNADFRAGKLDTGFLDRMLKQHADQGPGGIDSITMEVAVIAAGMFAVLDPATASSNGSGATKAKPASNWKAAGHREGLR